MDESTERDPSSYFASTAADYDEWYETPQGRFIDEIETELIFGLVPPVPGERVLDVGCGTGNFSFKLARRGCRVTGIDISPHMLRRALAEATQPERSELPVRFCQMDAGYTDFPDDYFDAVYSVTTFEFISDRAGALEELRRVLRPGGRMVIGTIAGDSPWGAAYRAAAADGDSVFRFADFPTRDELERLREDEVVDAGECLFIPPEAEADRFNREEERRRRDEGPGGFFAVAWQKTADPVACQVSLYPLAGAGVDAGRAVEDVLPLLRRHDPGLQVNPMSSVLSAPPGNLAAMLREVITHCRKRDLPFSLTLTASDVCSVRRGDEADVRDR